MHKYLPLHDYKEAIDAKTMKDTKLRKNNSRRKQSDSLSCEYVFKNCERDARGPRKNKSPTYSLSLIYQTAAQSLSVP